MSSYKCIFICVAPALGAVSLNFKEGEKMVWRPKGPCVLNRIGFCSVNTLSNVNPSVEISKNLCKTDFDDFQEVRLTCGCDERQNNPKLLCPSLFVYLLQVIKEEMIKEPASFWGSKDKSSYDFHRLLW
jgi:hypothetical protein